MTASRAETEYDLVVLGGGPAGYPAAIRAAQLGARVCLVERDRLGGTCLNRGCIPTKTLHAAAHLRERLRAAGGIIAGGGEARIDAAGLFANKRRVVDEIVSGVEKLCAGRAIEIVRGAGAIAGPGRISVAGHGEVRGAALVVATGSSEASIPGLPFDGERILGSTELLELERIPESMLVVGGGVIGCEFASIFNAFGAKVTIVEMLPALVSTEDAQIGRYLATFLKRKGIDIRLGVKVADARRHERGVTARLEDGTEVEAEIVLVSVGRRPNTAGIGLEEAGVRTGPGGIEANARMETSVKGIYAAGDVVGGWLLAHVATREGIVAAENALGAGREVRYDAVPSTIYTLPEISHVGMTEGEAKQGGHDYVTGRFPFAANGKAKGLGEEEGFVKWLAAADDERLLGLHIIGPHATELLAAGILAVEQGMSARTFAESIFPHPTLSEAVMEGAEAVFGRAIHVIR
jgi:dihydrolipoamide dehydrogenase